MEEQKGVLNDFVRRFKKLNTNAKVIIIGGAAACVIAIGAGFLYSGKSEKTVLFSNLNAADASQVTTKLEELKTPYSVKENSDGTMSILVDEEQSAIARMEVSATFEPSGGVVGYELLDNTSFGETQSDREQKRIRALEGEITKTLQKLPFVDWARVHINVSDNSFLSTNQEPSTASVTLKLKAGSTINKNQTTGIIKMISNSVSGLSPENVEVLDENANLLSDGIFNNDPYSSSDDQDSIGKEKEKNIRDKVQRLLDKVVGPGNSVVEVDLALNFDKKEIAEQILGEKVPVSEKEIVKETIINSGTNELPGVDSNSEQKDYVANEVTSNNGSTEKYTETQTNYEIATRNEKTIVATGTIDKMTLSVVVNEPSITKENGTVDENLKSELLNNIKTAAGFNADRNDEVSLTATKFNTDIKNEKEALAKQESTKEMISKGIVALAVVGALGVLVFLIKKASDTIKATTQKGDDSGDELKIEALSLKNAEVEGMPSTEDTLLIEERLNKTIDTNADDAVKAIRFMLSADENKK